ncbi:hypothetical protein F5884DRAFT_325774 [Xylogone sp. PMI_703]|nr:hypothetical protein F5884DRAFT_325774 [Xylogone sp. PMI_703]
MKRHTYVYALKSRSGRLRKSLTSEEAAEAKGETDRRWWHRRRSLRKQGPADSISSNSTPTDSPRVSSSQTGLRTSSDVYTPSNLSILTADTADATNTDLQPVPSDRLNEPVATDQSRENEPATTDEDHENEPDITDENRENEPNEDITLQQQTSWIQVEEEQEYVNEDHEYKQDTTNEDHEYGQDITNKLTSIPTTADRGESIPFDSTVASTSTDLIHREEPGSEQFSGLNHLLPALTRLFNFILFCFCFGFISSRLILFYWFFRSY